MAKLASDEIDRFYAIGITTPAERQFFDHALRKYSQAKSDPRIQNQFRKHIKDNETMYHPDN